MACSIEVESSESKDYEGAIYCKSCFEDLIAACRCQKSFFKEEMTCVREQWYCDDCLSECFILCESCDAYEDSERAVYSECRSMYYCGSCAEECISFCVRCDTEVDPNLANRNSDHDYVCDHCFSEEEDGEDENHSFPEISGTSFERSISKRKFGIEIEALLEDADSSHLPESDLESWKKQLDGSLGEGGREYASPILQGDQGFESIERFTEKLRRWGYFIRKECGLHVHIDGRDLDFEDIRKLLKLTLNFEAVIYAMLPESRFTGSYSVPLGKFPHSRIRKSVKNEEDLKALWYGKERNRVNLKSKFHSSRYYGVNIHSWFFRRSVEFRYHSGTLNPEKILTFIQICQAIVDKAKEEKSIRRSSFQSFNEQFECFIAYFGFSPEIREYVKSRILKFHPHLFDESLPETAR